MQTQNIISLLRDFETPLLYCYHVNDDNKHKSQVKKYYTRIKKQLATLNMSNILLNQSIEFIIEPNTSTRDFNKIQEISEKSFFYVFALDDEFYKNSQSQLLLEKIILKDMESRRVSKHRSCLVILLLSIESSILYQERFGPDQYPCLKTYQCEVYKKDGRYIEYTETSVDKIANHVVSKWQFLEKHWKLSNDYLRRDIRDTIKPLSKWREIYKYLPLAGYLKHNNPSEEKYRLNTFISFDVLEIMAILHDEGSINQGELGLRVVEGLDDIYCKNDTEPGRKLKRWIDKYLGPMGLIEITDHYEGKRRSNLIGLTEMGHNIICMYDEYISIDTEVEEKIVERLKYAIENCSNTDRL